MESSTTAALIDYDIDLTAAYALPPAAVDPERFALPLLRLPEHVHLVDGEAAINWLLKRDFKVKGGRQIIGTAHLPRVQGDLNPCFEWLVERLFGRFPDFLIVLDCEYWLNASDRNREILVYHELMHCIHKVDGFGDPRYDENDRPLWGIRGHDVEEFTAVVRRYGAWNAELESFISAAQAHTAEARFTAISAPSG